MDGMTINADGVALFHGSAIPGIKDFMPAQACTFGEGIYCTSMLERAEGYARHRAERGYDGELDFNREYDMPEVFSPVVYAFKASGLRLLDLRTNEKIADFLPVWQAYLSSGREQILEEMYGMAEEGAKAAFRRMLPKQIDRILGTDPNGRVCRDDLLGNGGPLNTIFSRFVGSLGFDGVVGTERAEFDMGEHDSYVIFDPKRLDLVQEMPLEGNHLPFGAYSNLNRLSRHVDEEEENCWTAHGTWGRGGAGILAVDPYSNEVLLVLRSPGTADGLVWGIPGGARKETESGLEEPIITAVSEFTEEMGGIPKGKMHRRPYVCLSRRSGFTYHTYVLEVEPGEKESFVPELNWENLRYKWFKKDELDGAKLHPGVKAVLAKMN